MNDIIAIGNSEIQVKEYQGIRVVTFKDVDAAHERPDGTARKRFNDNRDHFIECEDYFKVKCGDVRPFFGQTPPNGFNPDAALILLTESGYLMLVKSFTDDLAWKVQRQLVNTYFRAKEIFQRARPMSTPEMLLAQAQLMVEQERRLSNVENAMELLIAPPTVDWQTDMNRRMTSLCSKYSLDYEKTRSELYEEIERVGCWNLETRVTNARKRAEQSGGTKSQLGRITKLSIIASEPAMKAVYETQFQKLCSRCSYESGKVGC